MYTLDYASDSVALNDKLAQVNERWAERWADQEKRNTAQDLRLAELSGKFLYLARDKGLALSTALLVCLEAAATGALQPESKTLPPADTFSKATATSEG